MPDESATHVPEQFNSQAQQEEANSLGIWTFLSTEILFFGGLMLSYSVYRVTYHSGFVEGSAHLYFWIGTINTFILLTSSLFMALAVHSIQDGDPAKLRRYLLLTFAFGAGFLGLKLCEYYLDYREHLVPSVNFDPTHFLHPRSAEIFLCLYFAMTGLHAIHMTLGLSALTYLYLRARRNDFSASYHSPVRVVGLYWHFVDIVWVFLYPMLYLINN
jgi:cytochrome c oxidase subunit 3